MNCRLENRAESEINKYLLSSFLLLVEHEQSLTSEARKPQRTRQTISIYHHTSQWIRQRSPREPPNGARPPRPNLYPLKTLPRPAHRSSHPPEPVSRVSTPRYYHDQPQQAMQSQDGTLKPLLKLQILPMLFSRRGKMRSTSLWAQLEAQCSRCCLLRDNNLKIP